MSLIDGSGGYTNIPNIIIESKHVSKEARMLWIMLKYFCYGQKASCFPGMERLCELLKCSKPSIIKFLKELKENNMLKVERRGLGLTNNYTILLPEVKETDF